MKSIKVNKVQLSAVLGDTWNLKIGDKVITNETQSEENGDIIIALNQGTKTVDIEASKPLNNGAFLIESTKTLLKTEIGGMRYGQYKRHRLFCSVKTPRCGGVYQGKSASGRKMQAVQVFCDVQKRLQTRAYRHRQMRRLQRVFRLRLASSEKDELKRASVLYCIVDFDVLSYA